MWRRTSSPSRTGTDSLVAHSTRGFLVSIGPLSCANVRRGREALPRVWRPHESRSFATCRTCGHPPCIGAEPPPCIPARTPVASFAPASSPWNTPRASSRLLGYRDGRRKSYACLYPRPSLRPTSRSGADVAPEGDIAVAALGRRQSHEAAVSSSAR